MNYLEAIKSGKPYRRKGWSDRDWFVSRASFEGYIMKVLVSDALAEDWEIKEEPREWILAKCDGKWQVAEKSESHFGVLRYTGSRPPQEWVRVKEILE